VSVDDQLVNFRSGSGVESMSTSSVGVLLASTDIAEWVSIICKSGSSSSFGDFLDIYNGVAFLVQIRFEGTLRGTDEQRDSLQSVRKPIGNS
jgi:hypothetical protein